MKSEHSSYSEKPCSCWDGKPCVGCKKKKVIKPQVYLEEPRRLPVPIVISYYKQKKPTTVNRATEHRWPFWRRKDAPARPTTICKWFRKRKALKELKAEHEKERKRLEWDSAFRAEKEKEYEYFQQVYKQQAEKHQKERESKIVEDVLKSTEKPKKVKVPKPKKEKIPKPKKEKKVKVKKEKQKKYITPTVDTIAVREEKQRFVGKAASAKPRAASKCVSVKTYNRHQSLTERFVNCFYRFCCQLYCCVTILILIGVAVIVLI